MRTIYFLLLTLAAMAGSAVAGQSLGDAAGDRQASEPFGAYWGDTLEPLPPVEPDQPDLRNDRQTRTRQVAPSPLFEINEADQANDFGKPPAASVDDGRRSPSLGGPGFGGGGKSPFRFGGYFAPAAQVSGQASDLTLNGQQLDAALPIFDLTADRGLWLGMFNFEHIQLATSAILSGSRQPVPADLWNVSWGLMHLRKLDNGYQIGGMASIGSASDQPFAAIRDMTLTTLGFLNIPVRNENDAWNFSVFYSPASQIPFPVPGVAYAWRPSEQFQANIGVPFSLTYLPTTTCTISASYMPLTNVRFSVRRQFAESWYACTGYQSVTQTYFLADRIEDRERFYLFDQRVYLGLERSLGRGFAVDLTTAYLFDRQLFQAVRFAGNRSDELNVAAGLGVSLNLSWRR